MFSLMELDSQRKGETKYINLEQFQSETRQCLIDLKSKACKIPVKGWSSVLNGWVSVAGHSGGKGIVREMFDTEQSKEGDEGIANGLGL